MPHSSVIEAVSQGGHSWYGRTNLVLTPIPGSMRFPTPAAHLEDWLRWALSSLGDETLAVVYHPDQSVRVRVISRIIAGLDGTRLVAERYRSDKQFLLAWAGASRLPTAGTASDIADRLIDHATPVWIDQAHLLRRGMLGNIRDVFDQAGGPIVLSAGDAAILKNTGDRERGGQWFSRRVAYSP